MFAMSDITKGNTKCFTVPKPNWAHVVSNSLILYTTGLLVSSKQGTINTKTLALMQKQKVWCIIIKQPYKRHAVHQRLLQAVTTLLQCGSMPVFYGLYIIKLYKCPRLLICFSYKTLFKVSFPSLWIKILQGWLHISERHVVHVVLEMLSQLYLSQSVP